MKTIEKKILPTYYDAVMHNEKLFELRKDEDNIQVGDSIILREWDGKKFTGRSINREVTYVLRNVPEYGLMNGYCIIGLRYFQYQDITPSFSVNVNQFGGNPKFIGHVENLHL